MSNIHYSSEACRKGVHSWQWTRHTREDGATGIKVRWCTNCGTINTMDDPKDTIWAESNEGILSSERRIKLRREAGLPDHSEYEGEKIR